MKYYLRHKNNNLAQIGNKPFDGYTDFIDIPIEFKSEGGCKNNWKDIYKWIEDNTEIKPFCI